MSNRFLLLITCFALLTLPGTASAGDPTAETASISDQLTADWLKANNPWNAPPANKPLKFPESDMQGISTRFALTALAAGCSCTPQTAPPLAHSLLDIGRVRDALYDYVDKSIHWLRPGIGGPRWAKSCQMFIEANGNYGPYGRALSMTLSPQTHPNLFNNVANDMTRFCPAFKTWNDAAGIEKKKMFWIWLAASVSDGEASCNQDVKPKRGPYGILDGLFQLDKGKEETYPLRSPASDHCSKNSSSTAIGSGVCFFKMANYYVGTNRNIFDSPHSSDHYWQTLFTTAGGDKVRERLRDFTPCQTK